jgi:hypothetical protein
MKWFRVIYAMRKFSEEVLTDLVFSSEDRIHEDLADMIDADRKDIVIKEIFEYTIERGGMC